MMDHDSNEVEADSTATEESAAGPERAEPALDSADGTDAGVWDESANDAEASLVAASSPSEESITDSIEPDSPQSLDDQDLDAWARDALPQWLRSLAVDSRLMLDVLAEGSLSTQAKRSLVGGLNYLVQSLDLIDDGIEGLGYLEDALILRLSVARAGIHSGMPERLGRLSKDAAYVAGFLGALAPRMQAFALSHEQLTARGRSVQDILDQEQSFVAWRDELIGWADRYEAPAFACDASGLVKLRAFLHAKLPR